jgi:hypothetical protein
MTSGYGAFALGWGRLGFTVTLCDHSSIMSRSRRRSIDPNQDAPPASNRNPGAWWDQSSCARVRQQCVPNNLNGYVMQTTSDERMAKLKAAINQCRKGDVHALSGLEISPADLLTISALDKAAGDAQ